LIAHALDHLPFENTILRGIEVGDWLRRAPGIDDPPGIDDTDNFAGRCEPGTIGALHFDLRYRAARFRRAPASRL
jgi:hypothetical protein